SWHVTSAANVMRITDPARKSSERIPDADGTIVFRARVRGCKASSPSAGIGPYRSGRSPDWIKVKNPDAPASNKV
ncbi:MAG: hypothetical protein WAM77_07525, partial [Xanthobacteraceae bacterium]